MPGREEQGLSASDIGLALSSPVLLGAAGEMHRLGKQPGAEELMRSKELFEKVDPRRLLAEGKRLSPQQAEILRAEALKNYLSGASSLAQRPVVGKYTYGNLMRDLNRVGYTRPAEMLLGKRPIPEAAMKEHYRLYASLPRERFGGVVGEALFGPGSILAREMEARRHLELLDELKRRNLPAETITGISNVIRGRQAVEPKLLEAATEHLESVRKLQLLDELKRRGLRAEDIVNVAESNLADPEVLAAMSRKVGKPLKDIPKHLTTPATAKSPSVIMEALSRKYGKSLGDIPGHLLSPRSAVSPEVSSEIYRRFGGETAKQMFNDLLAAGYTESEAAYRTLRQHPKLAKEMFKIVNPKIYTKYLDLARLGKYPLAAAGGAALLIPLLSFLRSGEKKEERKMASVRDDGMRKKAFKVGFLVKLAELGIMPSEFEKNVKKAFIDPVSLAGGAIIGAGTPSVKELVPAGIETAKTLAKYLALAGIALPVGVGGATGALEAAITAPSVEDMETLRKRELTQLYRQLSNEINERRARKAAMQ